MLTGDLLRPTTVLVGPIREGPDEDSTAIKHYADAGEGRAQLVLVHRHAVHVQQVSG